MTRVSTLNSPEFTSFKSKYNSDGTPQVERAAESCATAMASVLPTEIVVRVLNPIVKTGDFPVNQAAVKMMTKG